MENKTEIQERENDLKQKFGSEHDLVITLIMLGALYLNSFADPTCLEATYKKMDDFYNSEIKGKKLSEKIKAKTKILLDTLNEELEQDAEAGHMASI